VQAGNGQRQGGGCSKEVGQALGWRCLGHAHSCSSSSISDASLACVRPMLARARACTCTRMHACMHARARASPQTPACVPILVDGWPAPEVWMPGPPGGLRGGIARMHAWLHACVRAHRHACLPPPPKNQEPSSCPPQQTHTPAQHMHTHLHACMYPAPPAAPPARPHLRGTPSAAGRMGTPRR